MEEVRYTLTKEERICSKLQIDKLFGGGGSHSFSAFPIRTVYLLVDEVSPVPAKILISVPKRYFKRAVKRNRVKRQIRECYRLNKHILFQEGIIPEGKTLLVAFIWIDDKLYETNVVERKVKNLLQRISEKCKA